MLPYTEKHKKATLAEGVSNTAAFFMTSTVENYKFAAREASCVPYATTTPTVLSSSTMLCFTTCKKETLGKSES